MAVAQGATGGTTVAATALLASRAGIRVFATGGIGGVHRNAGATFDESADLGILGSCRITVVAGGVKSILDIGATLERLETLSVTVLVFGTNRFPAFWLADSGYTVDSAVSGPEEIAAVMRAADGLGVPGGILVANPLPEAVQLDPALHDRLLAEALDAAERASVRGKDITPFLLDYIHEHTGRRSVAVNLEIVRGNCRLGAQIARSWSALQAAALPGRGPAALMLTREVVAFVRAALPAPPARVLEVGAGRGELAGTLSDAGYEVTAIDPAAEPGGVVERCSLLDVRGSFDAAVSVVALHHVKPLEESCAHLATLVAPGAPLVIDELDIDRYDERAVRWWASQRRALGFVDEEHEGHHPDGILEHLREHIHPLEAVCAALRPTSTWGDRSRAHTCTAGSCAPACTTPRST